MVRTKAARVLLSVITLAAATACGHDADVAKRELVARGDSLVAAKKYQEAVVEYRKAVAEDGRFGEARLKLAKAYEALGNTQNALKEFVRAADLLPDDAAAQSGAAQMLLRAGQLQDAKARAEGALKLDPKNVDAHLIRGTATAGLSGIEEAIKSFEESLAAGQQSAALYVNIGTLSAARGDLEQAEASLKQAIVIDAKSVAARLALANFYWASRRTAEAETSFTEAVAIDPKNVIANRALAVFYVTTGRPKNAEGPLRAAADAAPELQPRLILADYYVSQKREADALPILIELAKRKEAFAAATIRRAGIEYQMGQRDRAYGLVQDVLKQEPKNIQVLVVKGGWQLAEKKTADALTTAQAAVAADPKSADAYALLGSVHMARRNAEEAIAAFSEVLRINPRAVNAQISLSELNVAQQHAAAGVRFAEEALQSAPRSGGARLALVNALLAQGDVERARAELKPMLDVGAELSVVQVLLGQVQLRQGDGAGARRSFQRALQLDPGSIAALGGLVTLDLASKQAPQAMQRVDSYLAKRPSDPQALYLASRAYALGNDVPRAEAAVKKAIELDPSFLQAYGLLGQLYVRQGKLDQARAEYERTVQKRPHDVAAHTMVAMILQVQNRIDDAKKRYEQVLGIDPRAVVAANNLAYMHAEAGTNLDVALNLAQAAKSELPDDPDVNDTLGWVYYKRNLANLALEPLQRSISKEPRNALYRYHLGLAYLKVGDTKNARTSLEQALRLELDSGSATEAKKVLASLQG